MTNKIPQNYIHNILMSFIKSVGSTLTAFGPNPGSLEPDELTTFTFIYYIHTIQHFTRIINSKDLVIFMLKQNDLINYHSRRPYLLLTNNNYCT